jgi:signal peptide peptidase SppA
MNYPLIFQRVYMTPLCVHAARFQSIHAFLLPRLTGKIPFEVTPKGSEDIFTSARGTQPGLSSPRSSDRPPLPNKNRFTGKRRQSAGPGYDQNGDVDYRFFTEAKPGVAVVPVYGALAKNLSSWEEDCGGGTDINAIQEALRQAVADDSISTILLDIDSPGGEVTGIPEFGAQVRAATSVKPVYAFTDAMMASAAYWLGSQATELYVTPSSSVGSIGTYLAWLDETVKMKMEGVALQLFAAGKHKGIGLPGRPLTGADRALLQNRVDSINGQFTSTVRSTRPAVTDDTMQGQTFDGAQAEALGLVDGLVGSFDELLDLV